jgi:glycosyltransferase involved in cell wall biosynthesis
MSFYPFIGLNEIGQVSDLKKGFSRLGIESYACALEWLSNGPVEVDEIFASRQWTKHIRPQRLQEKLRYGWKREIALKKAVKEHDVFIFVWQSFKNDCSDFDYLKSKGKKIVVFFMGSEQRWCNAYGQEVEKFGIPNYYSRLPSDSFQFTMRALQIKLRYLRNVEKYADIIYSLPNQSQLSLRPYSHFYIPVDTNMITENSQQRKVPVVAHAPSNRAVKGTDIVLNTLEKLKTDGVKFETNLIENIPYSEALKMYGDSDIVIDQLFIPSGGKLAREALAAGKVVLSSVHREYIDNLPIDCPIVDVNPETLYDELKNIILDYPRRVELALRGRPFVEKYHSLEVVCRDVIKKLENTSSETENLDFYPAFFRKKFVPESNEHRDLYNYWTKFVSETDWYKKYIHQGERDGLLF